MERPYSFLVEWFDPQPQLTRSFLLKYYQEGQVEMYDLKSRRQFLKKSPAKLGDLRVGSEIVLHARVLKIVEYGDEMTREACSRQSALVVIPPCSNEELGARLGPRVTWLKMLDLNDVEAAELGSLLEQDVSLVGRVVICDDARGYSAKPGLVEAFAKRRFAKPTAQFGNNCACCVVRPHALKDLGSIVAMIPLKITAMELFKLDRTAAAEFLEVYDGVIPEYAAVVEQMSTGPCVAMELQGDVAKFRTDVCGPWDVEFAKELRPESIRAKFGVDIVRNAVHCTDLPDDGDAESRFFFQLLATN